jgi:hypothetical protein
MRTVALIAITALFVSCTGGRPGTAATSRSPTFGKVTNLGPPINSQDFDGGPSVSADGLSLYFVSDREVTSAGDIWVADATRPASRSGIRRIWVLPSTPALMKAHQAFPPMASSSFSTGHLRATSSSRLGRAHRLRLENQRPSTSAEGIAAMASLTFPRTGSSFTSVQTVPADRAVTTSGSRPGRLGHRHLPRRQILAPSRTARQATASRPSRGMGFHYLLGQTERVAAEGSTSGWLLGPAEPRRSASRRTWGRTSTADLQTRNRTSRMMAQRFTSCPTGPGGSGSFDIWEWKVGSS